jgi:formylglycine-generating enzyme required for sulfatase activity
MAGAMGYILPPPLGYDAVMRISNYLAAVAWLVLVFATANAGAEGSAPQGDLRPFKETIPGSDVSFEMVPIPAGEFLLGSPDGEAGREPDEGPQVKVKVEPFFMGKFEVTQAEYELFSGRYRDAYTSALRTGKIPTDQRSDAVTYPTPMYELELGPRLDRMGRGGRFPAVYVSYYAARQYTKWLSKKTGRFYRLPTEAEWEYACRAGTTTAYSFGDDPKRLDEHGWYYDNARLKDLDPAYREVGRKKPNAWGLYDMHGNVAELVAGQHDKELYAELKARPAAVNADDVVVWPDKEYPRIARGGSFDSEAEECRSASRHRLMSYVNNADPDLPRSPYWYSQGAWIGFRVVSPVSPPDAATQAKYWDELDARTRKYFDQKEERQVREVFPSEGQPPTSK